MLDLKKRCTPGSQPQVRPLPNFSVRADFSAGAPMVASIQRTACKINDAEHQYPESLKRDTPNVMAALVAANHVFRAPGEDVDGRGPAMRLRINRFGSPATLRPLRVKIAA